MGNNRSTREQPRKRTKKPENDDGAKAKKIKLDDSQDELHCSVCTELFYQAQTLSCSHTFCEYCIQKWTREHNFCPFCRTKINIWCPTLVIDNLIEKIIKNSSKEIQDQRRAVIEERNSEVKEDEPDKKKLKV